MESFRITVRGHAREPQEQRKSPHPDHPIKNLRAAVGPETASKPVVQLIHDQITRSNLQIRYSAERPRLARKPRSTSLQAPCKPRLPGGQLA